MNRFLPLILGFLFPLSAALAQDADASFRKKALELCKSSGGEYVLGTAALSGDRYCADVKCKKSSSVSNESATLEYAGQACISKKEYERMFENGGEGDGESSGPSSGSGSGTGNGEGEGGRSNANQSVFLDDCNYNLPYGHECWDPCTRWSIKEKKYVRKYSRKCTDCLGSNGIYVNGKGSNSIKISGVNCAASGLVRGADGLCVDARGRVVTTTSGDDDGGSTVVIDGGVRGEPSFCRSKKKTDKEDCAAWRRGRGRFNCSSSSRDADCMGDDYYDIQSRYDRDCVGGNCRGRDRRSNAWLGDAFGALFTAGGQVGSAYFTGRAYERANEAWAGAAAAGFEQCQISQNNYLAYTVDNQLPAVSPDQRNAMNCNGYQLNSFGGMGNPGMGAWFGGGYSPGMIGGMMGPYGGYNPYGGIQGGIVGGFAGGMQGGYVGGYPGGYVGGMAVGGFAGGMQGGYAGGYPGGYVGGMAVGGFAGGMQGGYVGGYPGGYAGGMAVGGYAGGYPGGFQGGMAAGGFAQGISLAGGFAGGMQGGYVQGGFAQGGFQGGYVQGGYAQGGFQGGFAGGIAGGFAQGGFQGGYPGGGMYPGIGGWGSGTANAGGWPGYGGAGNYWGATGGYGGQMDYGMSMSASNYDRSLQQQGMSYQMGMNAAPYGGGYGSAGFHPMNAGYGFGY